MRLLSPSFPRRTWLIVGAVLALTTLALIWVAALTPAAPAQAAYPADLAAPAVSTDIVISEFRTRGPNGGNDEFIELYNLSNATVDISGWKINASNASGVTSTRVTISSTTILGPGCHFLAVNTAANGYSGAVPGDQTYNTGVTDDGGVAVLNAANTIIDQVGMSAGSAYGEGTRLAPTTNNLEQSYERLPGSPQGNWQDTDNNTADFRYNNGTTFPQNRAGACLPQGTPGPTSTPGPPTSTGTATGTATATNTPGGPTATPTATVTGVRIRAIQGAQHLSPLNGQVVSNVPGIVTVRRSNGFYMQDPAPDANNATSEAIFVFTSAAPAAQVGDAVLVGGTVSEFRPGADTNNLATTEIINPTVAVQSSGNPLPTPVVFGAGGRVPPNMVIDDDATGNVETSGTFDADTDGIDFYESLEAMRVQVNNGVVVGPTNFGEIPVLADLGANGGLRTTRGGVIVRPNDFNPERIFLDDTFTSTAVVTVSDQIPLAIGVLDYSFGNFKLNITQPVTVVPGNLARESTTPQGTNQIAVGNFNVENLDPGDPPATFAALAGLIVNNLRAPDLLSIEEIQDNDGPTNSTVVAADVTWGLLISAIQAAGGPTYQYRQINPVDDQDGGEPGGNIRQGFLFRTDRGLAFIDRPGGCSTCATTVVSGANAPELSFSPGRLDPTNTAFNSSRKPLAGEFVYNGHKLFVVGNHWNSKGGDQPLFGRFQPPTLNSEVQRLQQAQIVNNFVDSILALNPSANIIVTGDLNDFYFSAPLQTLKGGASPVLIDLIETLPLAERYTYVFDGNSQDLDHTLISAGLSNKGAPQFDVVHVNAEYPDGVRASDHDPQVTRFTLAQATPTATVTVTPVATSTATRTVTPGLTATATATATACAGSGWGLATPIPMAVREHAVVSHGDEVYSFGGYISTGASAGVYKYTPATNTWTALLNMPARRAGARAVSDGTYIYILGGFDLNEDPTNTLWRYDPAANSYAVLASYTIPTAVHAAALLNGKIYRIAGRTSTVDTNTVEVYTISTNTWSMAANLPQPVSGAAALAYNGYVYSAGGIGGGTYRYDPISNTWDDNAIAEMPQARWLAASALYNGQWIVAGGVVGSASSSVVAWDPGTNTWLTLPNMLRALYTVGGASAGGAFYAVGGFDINSQLASDNQRYVSGAAACVTPTVPPSPTATATGTGPPTNTPTRTASPTVTRTATATVPISTPTRTATVPASATVTATPPVGATATATVCPIQFTDVDVNNPFYTFIRCLACRNIVSGYADGTFRWGNDVTRGQLSKIIAGAAGLGNNIPSTQQTFTDVPNSNVFWLFIEQLAGIGAISGYTCGGPGEPCDPSNRPYFRWGNNATRGQISKITAVTAGWNGPIPTSQQTFTDVPSTNPFWLWIEELAARQVISGYTCGGAGEPCGSGNRPYFRWGNNATRGQMSKIAAQSFFPKGWFKQIGQFGLLERQFHA